MWCLVANALSGFPRLMNHIQIDARVADHRVLNRIAAACAATAEPAATKLLKGGVLKPTT